MSALTAGFSSYLSSSSCVLFSNAILTASGTHFAQRMHPVKPVKAHLSLLRTAESFTVAAVVTNASIATETSSVPSASSLAMRIGVLPLTSVMHCTATLVWFPESIAARMLSK